MTVKNKIIVCIVCLFVLVISIVVYININSNKEYDDYMSSTESFKSVEWVSHDLDISKANELNVDVLSGYHIDISSIKESELFYDGNSWSGIVMSSDGVYYNVVIGWDYSISVEEYTTDSEMCD